MKTALLIANTHSGRGVGNAALGVVLRALTEGGYRVTAVTTSGPGDAEELARKYAQGRDLVVVMGGDGTLSQVVSGLMRMSPRPPVGYVPAGTACDVASTLGLPRSPAAAVRRILAGRPRALDVGEMNGESSGNNHAAGCRDSGEAAVSQGGFAARRECSFFTYIAAFGAFTDVAYRTTQAAKAALGHLAYVFGAVGELGGIQPRRAEVLLGDGGVIRGDFIFGGVSNATRMAGMIKLPPERVKLDDGRFEVLLVKKPVSAAALGGILTDIIAGRYASDDVILLTTSGARFAFDGPVPWTRDGEDGGRHETVEIRNRRAAVEIVL